MTKKKAPPSAGLPAEQIDQIAALIEAAVSKVMTRLSEDDKLLVTVTEAARRLSLSKRAMNALIADGVIPSFTVRRTRLIDVAALEAYREALRQGLPLVMLYPPPLPSRHPVAPNADRG